jgi:hypothetical protein
MNTTALAAVAAVGDVAKPVADTLIVYSGPTSGLGTPESRDSLYAANFRFFLRHGHPCSWHDDTQHTQRFAIVLVLTKASARAFDEDVRLARSRKCAALVATRVAIRRNRCLDMESARLVLGGSLAGKKHRFVIFLNCGLRGPLLPLRAPPGEYWASRITRRLERDPRLKLVGLTINCFGFALTLGKKPLHQVHVQSMLWCTDAQGLAAIVRGGAMYDCGQDGPLEKEQRNALINRYELGLSRHVLQAGYRIGTISGIQGEYDQASSVDSICHDVWNQGDLHQRITAENMTFWKVSRQFPTAVRTHAARQEELLIERRRSRDFVLAPG